MAEDEIRSLGEISEKIIQRLAETAHPFPAIPEKRPAISGRSSKQAAAARIKALEVYALACAANISQVEAVNRHGSTRHTVSEAGIIIENGTPEEIQAARSGLVSFASLVRAIRDRIPHHEIKSKVPSPKPPWTGGPQRAKAKAYERFRIALEFLADGPPPEELIAMARESDTRRQLVNNKLTNAYSYLSAFIAKW